MEEKIKTILRKIKPALLMAGGEIQFVGIADNVVSIKINSFGCGCHISPKTVQIGLEKAIKREIPEIQKVQAVF